VAFNEAIWMNSCAEERLRDRRARAFPDADTSKLLAAKGSDAGRMALWFSRDRIEYVGAADRARIFVHFSKKTELAESSFLPGKDMLCTIAPIPSPRVIRDPEQIKVN
jgi:hypothetical protein